MDKSLSDQDQARVDRYLQSGTHSVERKPFRPLLLLGVIWGVLLVMSAASYWIAKAHGVI